LPESYEIEVLEPFKEAMVQQISRLLQFFFAGSEYNKVDQVVLAGGCASIAGVHDMVEEQLGVPCRRRQPLANMSLSSRVRPDADPGRAGADDRLRARAQELRLMAKINLLPWRAERRRQREREFYTMLGAAALAAVAVLFGWWYWMGLRLDNQDARNAYLKDQIKQLDGQLAEIKELDKTKAKLLARKQIIEQLQAAVRRWFICSTNW
jgi:hypothetical protein